MDYNQTIFASHTASSHCSSSHDGVSTGVPQVIAGPLKWPVHAPAVTSADSSHATHVLDALASLKLRREATSDSSSASSCATIATAASACTSATVSDDAHSHARSTQQPGTVRARARPIGPSSSTSIHKAAVLPNFIVLELTATLSFACFLVTPEALERRMDNKAPTKGGQARSSSQGLKRKQASPSGKAMHGYICIREGFRSHNHTQIHAQQQGSGHYHSSHALRFLRFCQCKTNCSTP